MATDKVQSQVKRSKLYLIGFKKCLKKINSFFQYKIPVVEIEYFGCPYIYSFGQDWKRCEFNVHCKLAEFCKEQYEETQIWERR